MAAALTPPSTPAQPDRPSTAEHSQAGRPLTAQDPQGPPPLPQWYLGVGGERRGPFDETALPAAGLAPDVLVWRSGMPQWVPARDVPELAALLRDTPPPLPPA
ncbi:DUF4339 domain-containing protein [Nonomuraea polychroma]|uniref:DUF4339 domain-containing protein n=1 Tax=Nonomuraea polychroma TaxID=46176 RepID=UPI003D8F3787